MGVHDDNIYICERCKKKFQAPPFPTPYENNYYKKISERETKHCPKCLPIINKEAKEAREEELSKIKWYNED